ncbi:MAG: single-stranded DNA-binding protein [Proteobacteria bacterium]|nr:MAG: single-stranded DNA-binding protein [Pseudomonadota bacterium]
MASVNKAIIVGKLGRDPEFSYLPKRKAVCAFDIATAETWIDNGERKEKTEWHRIKVWGKTAENCGKHLSKGKMVFIEEKLHTSQWVDKKSGEKRYATEIVAENVIFLSPSSESRNSDKSQTAPREFAEVSSCTNQSLDDVSY